ncbi:hypothetical protein AMJ47_01590 [Parcubacteria bacterium DG_72]|nr:MAG: hypothetical protein AMJ47_01590 [Parcubacteria bacterium DG_72]
MSTQRKKKSWVSFRHKIPESARFLYKKFIEPKSKNEDLKRREFILNIFLLCILILYGAGFLFSLYFSVIQPEYKAINPLVLLAIFIIFLLLYIVSRFGFFAISTYIFIGILFIATTYAVYKWGIELPPGLLFFSLVIIISGILISTRFAFIIALISSLSIAVVNYLQINNIKIPDLYWKAEKMKTTDITVLSIIFGVIATVSWLSNREIEKSLKRARKSEAVMKESEKRFRQFFENEPEYCYMISPEGRILDINASALKTLGYEKQEIIGKPFLTTIYAPSSYDKAKNLFMKWKKTGKLRNEELNIITKNKEERIILLSADAMRNAKGEIVHSISVQRDITERKQAEEALQKEKDLLEVKVEQRTKELKKVQIEKMSQLYRFAEFGRLSTGLFHDLVNPLTAVSLNIERIEGQPETKEYLDRAIKATKRMENFISAVRKQMSHQESKALFFLTKQIQQAIQILLYKAQELNIKITFFPNENIQTYGDPIKFSQIITNLINNAVDAYSKTNKEINKRREIEIKLSQRDNIISLTVEDWGCGISKEVISKIFQPLFTTKNAKQGIGMGLSLIKTIIEKDFHGNIKVESYENKGTKFIIKFPKIMMENPVYYLINQQQEDGSFLDSNKSKSILFTSLILSCLNNLEETDQIKDIKQKAANFLLSQKDDNWLFSENIGINFCVLSTLTKYNPEIINGEAIAKILMTLTSVESKEGGPYYSSKVSNNVDIGVNASIAYFLSLQNVDLPELNNLIEAAIDSGNFKSELFRSDYPVIYLISKFYKGSQKGKLAERLQNEINYLKRSDISSSSLNTAFYLEASNPIKKKESDKSPTDKEKQIYNRIIKLAEQRFSSLNGEIKDYAMREIKKTIKGNSDKQMTFMAYYFKKALGKKGEKISDDLIAKFGLANIFFWTAFIIYDDFWDEDEEANPKILPTANLYARHFTNFFTSLSIKKEFHQFFREIMDKLDAANTWETVYCRTKVESGKLTIPENIPNYGNYDLKYQPASGHILGPVAMLYLLGYKENSPEMQNLISYFRNYLIAMQINDDAHDWEEDLRRGHLSTVVVMLLQDYLEKYPNKKEIDTDKELEELQKIFWFKTIVKACQTAIFHTDKSRKALKSITILEDITPLERFIIIAENVAKKALKEQETTTDFLKSYKA